MPRTTPLDVGVFVQAHPSRSHLHPALIASLAPLPVEVSIHSSNPPNPWAGYKKCLQIAATEISFTHFVVLQDDAVVCADFTPAVTAAIEDRPEQVLSLWVGALPGRTRKDFWAAQGRRDPWAPVYFRDIHHCVALVWPRALAEEFLEWTDSSRMPGDCRAVQSDDAIIGAWARRTKKQFWATVPCLVEHIDDPETVPSTIARPQGDKGRQAIAFAGA